MTRRNLTDLMRIKEKGHFLTIWHWSYKTTITLVPLWCFSRFWKQTMFERIGENVESSWCL